MTGKHALQHLPLRKLGFEHAPAVPVDLPGLPDTLVRLGVKVKQYEQALQGLARTYTIGGTTARAYTFLYGDESPDAKRTRALHRFLPRTGTIGEMLHFYFIFWATPPYVPFVPLAGTGTDLFFDDEISNDALNIEL